MLTFIAGWVPPNLDRFPDDGLRDTRALVDAVVHRQEENRSAALTRGRSADSAVAEYARASAAWQTAQIEWLRSHAGEPDRAQHPAQRVARLRAPGQLLDGAVVHVAVHGDGDDGHC